MKAIPLTLKEANELVAELHRHHKPVRGHRFSIGAEVDGEMVGAAIVGRPVARKTCQRFVAEVTRLVTNGSPNACSFLYGRCARAARAMGFRKIQTFTLKEESGASLRGAGWVLEAEITPPVNGWNSRPGRWGDPLSLFDMGEIQPKGPKTRWSCSFSGNA